MLITIAPIKILFDRNRGSSDSYKFLNIGFAKYRVTSMKCIIVTGENCNKIFSTANLRFNYSWRVLTCRVYWGPGAIVLTVSGNFYKDWPSETRRFDRIHRLDREYKKNPDFC